MENKAGIFVDVDGDESDLLLKFGLTWLDTWFSGMMKNDILADMFKLVEDNLGNLVKGDLDSAMKQHALFTLLGPSFVAKHLKFRQSDLRSLEQMKIQDVYKDSKKYAATFENIEKELSELAKLAFKKIQASNFTGDVTSEIEKSFQHALEKYISFKKNNINGSIGSICSNISRMSCVPTSNFDIQEGEKETIIGNALAAFIDDDQNETLLRQGCNLFRERCLPLPGEFRSIVYENFYLTREANEKGTSTKQLFSSFTHQMKKNKGVAVQSEDYEAIKKYVIESYTRISPVKQAEDREGGQPLFAIRVLNILKRLTGKRQEKNLLWLIPLHELYEHKRYDDEDYIVETAYRLSVLVKRCQLSQNNLFRIVDEMYESLSRDDPEYINHLTSITSHTSVIDLRDFREDVISVNCNKAHKFWYKILKLNGKLDKEALSVFSDSGKVFVRKWMSDGFVGALNPYCRKLVWDIMFLYKWSDAIWKTVGLALMALLKPWAMHAKHFDDLQQVFFNEPAKFYRNDVRNSIIHLLKGNSWRSTPVNTNCTVTEWHPIKVEPAWKPINFLEKSDIEPIKLSFADIPMDKISSKIAKLPDSEPESDGNEEVEDEEPWTSLWLPYNPANDTKLPQNLPDPSHKFDIYIDFVRFVPDSIELCKVSCCIYNLSTNSVPDNSPSLEFEATPLLNSNARYPRFKFKFTVNEEEVRQSPAGLLAMKLIGLQKLSEKPVVVGTALMDLFKKEKGNYINVGYHQIPVRRGLLNTSQKELNEQSMDMEDKIPALSILLRLWPYTDNLKEAPYYEYQKYNSTKTTPRQDEMLLYKHYYLSEGFQTENVVDRVRRLMSEEQPDEEGMLKFVEDSLCLQEDLLMDVTHFTTYDNNHGFRIKINSVMGLPPAFEDRYMQCFVEVVDYTDRNNTTDRFFTQNVQMKSYHRFPKWSEKAFQILHQKKDTSILLIKAYTLQPEYSPSWEKEPNGKLKGMLELEYKKPDCWTMGLLFDENHCVTGTHILPIFTGSPTPEVFNLIIEKSFNVELVKMMAEKKAIQVLSSRSGYASISLTIMDGYMNDSTAWTPNQDSTHRMFLEAVGKLSSFPSKPDKKEKGKKYADFVTKNLPPKIQKKGTKSSKYKEEEPLFLGLVREKFRKAFNMSLSESAKVPLSKNEFGEALVSIENEDDNEDH